FISFSFVMDGRAFRRHITERQYEKKGINELNNHGVNKLAHRLKKKKKNILPKKKIVKKSKQ
ncbi:hypothetical protein ACTHSK_10620, partial [Neisseria sp. P0012.S006]|uniref:hypothetical protein n=1 Tax=Neisseria sp. P0012.S006 TaxID=3436732 RepID=UPI003F803A14